jgi:hypothetical protein
VHFNVTQRGAVEVQGTSEAIAPFARIRVLPSAAPWATLSTAAQKVGIALAERKLYGFASLDCVVCGVRHTEESPVIPSLEEEERFYIVDLDLRMTHAHSALFMFLFMTRCYFDEQGQLRSQQDPSEVRFCALTTSLHAPGAVPAYEALFGLFKSAKLSFDLVTSSGSILVHADQRGQYVSLGTVSARPAKALQELRLALGLFDNGSDGDIFQVLSLLRVAGSQGPQQRTRR